MIDLRQRLIWIDGIAGLAVGLGVLLFSGWLSDWYRLPVTLLYATGAANLIYGTYSTTLATRPIRPLGMIAFLVIANLSWSVVCLILTIRYFSTASVFGLGHLIGEGLFVAVLACFEWRWRDLLRRRPVSR